MVKKGDLIFLLSITVLGVVSIILFLFDDINVPSFGLVKSATKLAIDGISKTGYVGIALLTALEVVVFPIPSEIILPFSGYLAYLKRFSLYGVVLAGTIGSLIGSLAIYYLGLFGGRKILLKYGKYFMISENDIKMAEEWFNKYGEISVLISRLAPIVRTVISFPAGIGKMNIKKFIFYTTIGSSLWCYLLAYSGYVLGPNWTSISSYFEKLDIIALITVVILSIRLILKLKEKKQQETETKQMSESHSNKV